MKRTPTTNPDAPMPISNAPEGATARPLRLPTQGDQPRRRLANYMTPRTTTQGTTTSCSTPGTTHRTTRRVSALAVFLGAAMLSGCGAIESGDDAKTAQAAECERSDEKTIGFDYPLTSLAVYGNLQSFAEQRAAERGYTLKYTADDNNLEKQIQNVQTWVNQKIPAIVSYPLEPSAMEPLATQARNNCEVFVSYAAPLKNQDAAVLFSGLQSGQELGKTASAWAAQQSGTVKVLVISNRDLAVGAERDDGLNETFPGDAKNVDIVATQKAGTREEGEEVTRTVLQAHPDLAMVLAYNDDTAIGARQAMLNAGADPKDPGLFIGGQDGSEEGLKAVQEGGIYRVSVAVRIRDIGFAVVDVPADLLEGKKTDGVNVPPVSLTADHPQLSEYIADYTS